MAQLRWEQEPVHDRDWSQRGKEKKAKAAHENRSGKTSLKWSQNWRTRPKVFKRWIVESIALVSFKKHLRNLHHAQNTGLRAFRSSQWPSCETWIERQRTGTVQTGALAGRVTCLGRGAYLGRKELSSTISKGTCGLRSWEALSVIQLCTTNPSLPRICFKSERRWRLAFSTEVYHWLGLSFTYNASIDYSDPYGKNQGAGQI